MGKHISPEAQRQKILDAAVFCLTELGYDGTSVDAIAARCGLSTREVSGHFAVKADIRDALLELWSERFSAWISSA